VIGRQTNLPGFAAWRHGGSRAGFEVVFLSAAPHPRAVGSAAAVEDEEPLIVNYTINLDDEWITTSAHVAGRSLRGARELRLDADGLGGWLIDGQPSPALDGCLDVDLESSCLTNALPVHRLSLRVGEAAEAPAAYVRALDLHVERLEQRYKRLEDRGATQRYHYEAPAFDFECELVYDHAGLVLDYPGIGERVA